MDQDQLHISLTSACWVHSNVYGLDKTKCIRYQTTVDPFCSTSSAVQIYHHLTSGSVEIPLVNWGRNSGPIGEEPVPYNHSIVWEGRQQTVWLVMQSRASSPSPMSSRVTILLFWYVVPLSENLTSPAPGKKEIQLLTWNFTSLIHNPCTKNQFFGWGLGRGYVLSVILIKKATTKPLATSDKKKNDTKKHFYCKRLWQLRRALFYRVEIA